VDPGCCWIAPGSLGGVVRVFRIDWVFRVVGGCLSQQPHRSLNSLRINRKKGKIPVTAADFTGKSGGGWVLFLHSEPSENSNHPTQGTRCNPGAVCARVGLDSMDWLMELWFPLIL
jgi:hypothetical protein